MSTAATWTDPFEDMSDEAWQLPVRVTETTTHSNSPGFPWREQADVPE